MAGVWIVIRQSDTGRTEVWAAFTSEVAAADNVHDINRNEYPRYVAWAVYVEIDYLPK